MAYGIDGSDGSDRIWFTSVDGGRTVSFKTGFVACGEPALVQAGSRVLLAYTALPNEGSDWRKLHVADVTNILQ